MSVTSIVSVLALGVGTTFALLTSNTATLSNNTITTGSAAIKLCKANAGGEDNWKNTLAGNFTLSDMVPGASERELTAGADIEVGNDSGTLTDNLTGPTRCNGYLDAASSSDVNLKLVPKIETLVCPGTLPTDLQLRFDIGGIDSGYGTLAFWQTNTTQYGVQFSPDQNGQIKVFSQLSSGATQQNNTCTFDLTFTGGQV